MLGVLAKAIYDSNQAVVSAFLSFRPTYAQGAGLSSLVQINGLLRNMSGYSTAAGYANGVSGTHITNGQVRDLSGNLWNIDNSDILIGNTGRSSNVSLTCVTAGAVSAGIGSATIVNAQTGWNGFTIYAQSSLGTSVESDDALRYRQALSTTLPSQNTLDALHSALLNVTGVVNCIVYENADGSLSYLGIPVHSIAIVLKGRFTNSVIASTIANKKPPGIQTYGSVTLPVTLNFDQITNISFTTAIPVPVYFSIVIQPRQGYPKDTPTQIQNDLISFIDSLKIGDSIYTSQVQAVASLYSSSVSSKFYIVSFLFGKTQNPITNTEIDFQFFEYATTDKDKIVISAQ
jgi:uncharacterized phage protein gp47/JayE